MQLLVGRAHIFVALERGRERICRGVIRQDPRLPVAERRNDRSSDRAASL